MKQKMLISFICAVNTLLFCLNGQSTVGVPFNSPDDFSKKCLSMAASIGADKNVISGRDGWLFGKAELAHIGKGPFCDTPGNEAFNAIVDFKKQLEAAGIDLIIVPVPPKAVVYAEKLPEAASVANTDVNNRNDKALTDLYERLAKNNVTVIDITNDFILKKTYSLVPYCKQDTHWSSQGSSLAAKIIASRIKKDIGKINGVTMEYKLNPKTIEITGDLWSSLNDKSIPKEKVEIIEVKNKNTDSYIGSETSSPVLLIGDSHCLIFHAGEDMQAVGAGLPDFLACELGFPVSVIAIRGSGATPTRIALARKLRSDRNFLEKTKVVIWCFAAREFTEANGGWKKIPIFPKR